MFPVEEDSASMQGRLIWQYLIDFGLLEKKLIFKITLLLFAYNSEAFGEGKCSKMICKPLFACL